MGPLPCRRFWILGLLSYCFLQVVSQNTPCFQETCQNGMCQWTQRGFMCVCDTGFENPPGDTSTCVDINECAQPTACPNGQCINYYGTHHCKCYHGYTETSNRQGCVYDATVGRSNTWAYSSFLESIGYTNRDQYAPNTDPINNVLPPDQSGQTSGYQAFINSLQTGPNSQIMPSEYLTPSPQPDFLERYVQNLVDPQVQPPQTQPSYNQVQPPYQPQQPIVQPALQPQSQQPAYSPMPSNVNQQNTYPSVPPIQPQMPSHYDSNLASQHGHNQFPMNTQVQPQTNYNQQGYPVDSSFNQPQMQPPTAPHYGSQGSYQPILPPMQPPVMPPIQPPVMPPIQPPMQPIPPPTNFTTTVSATTTPMPATTTTAVFVETEAPEFPVTQSTVAPDAAGSNVDVVTGPPQPSYIETTSSQTITSAANQSNNYAPTSHQGMAIIPNGYDQYAPVGNQYQQHSGHQYTQHQPTYQQSYHGSYPTDQSYYGQPAANNWNPYPAYNQLASGYGYPNTQTFMPQSYYNQYQQTPYNQHQQSGHYGHESTRMDNSQTGIPGQTYPQFPEQQTGVNEPSYNPGPVINDPYVPSSGAVINDPYVPSPGGVINDPYVPGPDAVINDPNVPVPSIPDSVLPGTVTPGSAVPDLPVPNPNVAGNVIPGPGVSTGYVEVVTDSSTQVPARAPTTTATPSISVTTQTLKATTNVLPQQNSSTTPAPVIVDVRTTTAQVAVPTNAPTVGPQVVNTTVATTTTARAPPQHQTVPVTTPIILMPVTTPVPSLPSTNNGGTFGDTWLKQNGQNVQIGVGLDLSNMNPVTQKPPTSIVHVSPVKQPIPTTPYYPPFVQYVPTTVKPVPSNQGVQDSTKTNTQPAGYDQVNIFTSPDKNANTKMNQYNTPTQYVSDSANNVNTQYASTGQNNQHQMPDLISKWRPDQTSNPVAQPATIQQQFTQMQSGNTMTQPNQWDQYNNHQSNVSPQIYPTGSNNYPTGSNNYPTGSNINPTGSNNFPTGSINYPTGSNINPTGSNNYPTGSNINPTGSNNYPTGSNNYPAGTNNYPTGSNNYPTGSNINPTGSNNYPTGSNNYPTGSNINPTGSNNYPAGSNSNPTGSNIYPTGSNNYPTGSNNYPTGAQSYPTENQRQRYPVIPTLELTNPTNSQYQNQPSASYAQTQSASYQQYNPVPQAAKGQYQNQNGPVMGAMNQQQSNNIYQDNSQYQSTYTQNQIQNGPANTVVNTQSNIVYPGNSQYPITYNQNEHYPYSQAHNSPSFYDSHVWYTPQQVPSYTDLPMTRAVATYPREYAYGSDPVYGRWKTAGEAPRPPPKEPVGNPLASDNILMAFLMSEAFA